MDTDKEKQGGWKVISEAELQQIHDFALYDLRQKWMEEENQNQGLTQTDR